MNHASNVTLALYQFSSVQALPLFIIFEIEETAQKRGIQLNADEIQGAESLDKTNDIQRKYPIFNASLSEARKAALKTMAICSRDTSETYCLFLFIVLRNQLMHTKISFSLAWNYAEFHRKARNVQNSRHHYAKTTSTKASWTISCRREQEAKQSETTNLSYFTTCWH